MIAHTREQLEAMTDRELDAVVAEIVFRQSLGADTEAKIGQAVMDGMFVSYGNGTAKFRWNNVEYGPVALHNGFTCRDGYKGIHDNDCYGLWIWDSRSETEWAADLEAHVSGWHEQVTHYSGTYVGFGQIVERMRELGFDMEIKLDASLVLYHAHFSKHPGYARLPSASTLSRATAIAAVLAVEGAA